MGIGGTILGLIGIVMILAMLKNLLSALLISFGVPLKVPSFSLSNLGGSISGANLAKAEKRIKQAKETGNFSLLKKSFVFLESPKSFEVVSRVDKIHSEILNTVKEVQKSSKVKFRGLDTLTELTKERTQLLKDFISFNSTKSKITNKQKEKGHTPKNWATKEFIERLKEVGVNLSHNKRDILLLFTRLEEQLENANTKKEEPPKDEEKPNNQVIH